MDPSSESASDPSKVRKQLGESLLQDLLSDWRDEGASAIAKARADKPMDYLKLIATALPKDFASIVKANELEELSEEQLDRQLSALLASLEEAGDKGRPRNGAAETP